MFKLIKYFIFWIVPALLFVQGCSSHDSLRQVPPQKIIALGKDPQNFYIVSADYAFQFPAEQLLPVEVFLQTSLMKKITTIFAEVVIHPDQGIYGNFCLATGTDAQLSKKQISRLLNDYGFEQKDLNVYSKKYYFYDGEMIQVENRDDFIAHNKLETAIPLEVSHIDRTKISTMKLIGGGMGIILLVLLSPFVIDEAFYDEFVLLMGD